MKIVIFVLVFIFLEGESQIVDSEAPIIDEETPTADVINGEAHIVDAEAQIQDEEAPIVDVINNDAKECEDNMKVFNNFCPEGNRCLTKVKEAIECVIETLKDLSFEMDHESVLTKMEEEIQNITSSFNEKIERLENELTSLQEEKIVNETTFTEHIVIESPEMPSEELNISDTYIHETKQESDGNEFFVSDSPCLYISRDENFILTANLGYESAKKCCDENDATPFIPRSQADFIQIILKITSGARFGWLPLTDLVDGTPMWDDGEGLHNSSFAPRFTSNPDYATNQNNKHCVGATSAGLAYWVSCDAMMKLLCIGNNYNN